MTNEDQQHTMDFILQQQAQMAAHIQQLEEDRIRDRPRMIELEQSFQTLVDLAQITDTRLDSLELRNAALETRSTALETNMAALASAQAHADERVSALIDIIIEGRGRAL